MSQSIQATVRQHVLNGRKIQILCGTRQGQTLKLSGPAGHPVLASLQLGDSIRIMAKNHKWQRIERLVPHPASVDSLVQIASPLPPLQKLELAVQLLRQCQVFTLEHNWQLGTGRLG